jgi:hypothetical protein
MSILGSPGSEDRKKFYAMCGFGVLFAGVLYYYLGGSDAPVTAPPPPVVITAPAASSKAPAEDDSVGNTARVSSLPAAKPVGTTSAALDPTLHMEAMLVTESVEYGGNGRNIFSAMSAPVVAIPVPVAKARPTPPPPPPPPPVPCPPNCPPPPPPPPIDLKFIGTIETPPGSGHRQAFILHGDDVWVASAGDIVLRRYRIISITANSIQVEDMPNNNKQSLPLLAN